jgi:sepiapterin reductase
LKKNCNKSDQRNITTTTTTTTTKMNSTRIIITGASRGIGASLAHQMSLISKQKSIPFDLLLTATNETKLSQVVDQCASHNQCKVSKIVGDITESNVINSIVKFVQSEWNGTVNVLIHNAGIIDPIKKIGDMSDQDLETFERNMNVNFISAIKLTNKLLPFLRTAKGNVTFISTGAATSPIDGWSAYCSSKAALLMFANCLATEEKGSGIRVLSIRPGVVATDMQKRIRETGKGNMSSYDYFKELHETGKLLDPELVAQRICAIALDIPEEWNGQLVNQDSEKVIERANRFYGKE